MTFEYFASCDWCGFKSVRIWLFSLHQQSSDHVRLASGSNAPGLSSTVTSSLWISSSLVWTSTAPITRSLLPTKMCGCILSTCSGLYSRLWILTSLVPFAFCKQVVVGSRKSQPPSAVHFPYCGLFFMRLMFYWIIQCMMSNHTLTCAVHAGVRWCSLPNQKQTEYNMPMPRNDYGSRNFMEFAS